jgi:hypothetical protein
MNDQLSERIQEVRLTAAKRGLRMNPCLEENEISTFENLYKAYLPQDYREFLKKVGNGGSGPPYYGLLPLGEVPSDFQKTAAEVLSTLQKPFPLSNYWVWEGEREERPELSEAINQGYLVLGTDGCGIYWLLIVTGSERGQIWWLTDVGIQPCAPRRQFLDWYEYWLEGGEDWWGEFRQ